MQTAAAITFSHRRNAAGSHDSICPVCFSIVTTDADEAQLHRAEESHHCDPLMVYQVRQSRFPRSSILRPK